MPARTKRKAVEEPKEEVKSAKVLNNLAYRKSQITIPFEEF